MTNKAIVQVFYPKAFSYRVASHLVHIRRGNNRGGNLGWGWTVKQAWANAVAKLRSEKPRKPKKQGKPLVSVAQAKRLVQASLRKTKKIAKSFPHLSNAELNSGWKTQAVDHGAADSMAGWPKYLD